MAYYLSENTGVGFITHEDNETAHIAELSANIFKTENSVWAARVGAVEKTKEEAQAIINASLEGSVYPEGHPNAGEQVVYTLD